MKNKLIFVILIISIVLVICLTVFGFKIGSFEIPSLSKMIAKNNDINSGIEQVSKLTSADYPQAINKLETTIDSLNVQKEKYEQIAGFTSEGDTSLYETERYDISYLWTVLGEYASKNKINLAIDVKKSTGTDLYDLYFTIQGEYVDISDFITKIENDSDLSFRIYNFNIVPGSSNINLKATFTVKDVNIDDSTLIKTQTGLPNNLNTMQNNNSNTIQNNNSNTTKQ